MRENEFFFFTLKQDTSGKIILESLKDIPFLYLAIEALGLKI